MQLSIEHDTTNRPGGQAIRPSHRHEAGGDLSTQEGQRPDMAMPVRLRGRKGSDRGTSQKWDHTELRTFTHPSRDVRDPRIQRVGSDDSALHKSEVSEFQKLRSQRNQNLPPVGAGLQKLPGRYGATADTETLTGQEGQQRKLHTRELPLGDGNRAGEQQAFFTCPSCKGRVRYVGRVGEKDWYWEKYIEGTPQQRLDTRENCIDPSALNHCRPCPFSSCRRHLLLEVTSGKPGRVIPHYPEVDDLERMPYTCVEDVILDYGDDGLILDQVGEILNLTRERVRQVETTALRKLRRLFSEEEITAILGRKK